jgi:sugar phosphate isomerase/epimerase
VLHLGRVPMQNITKQLTDLTESGSYLSREFVQEKIKAIKTREERAPHYLIRVKECLDRIVEHATSKNIHLGIESRHSYDEIPSEREIPGLLAEINSPYVGYWHDFGHIQIKENLTFLDHFEWLSKIRGRLLGCHLHDAVWPDHDHRPPFTGDVKYEKLIPLLPKNCLFVWEMSPRRKPDEIKESLKKWKDRFGSGN